MIYINKTFISTLCLFTLASSLSQTWADENNLTAKDLASALDIQWVTIILPGTEQDKYSVGSILEFGDGTKSVRSGGMIGPIKGGSKIKFFVKEIDGKFKCSLVSDIGTSHSELPVPVKYEGNKMSTGGTLKYEDNVFFIKCARDNAGITSRTPLKINEFGIRLIAKKKK